jgi:flavin prenyltransferase
MKIVVAISGASGSIYARAFINTLLKISEVEVSCIVSETAFKIWKDEIGGDPVQLFSEQVTFLDNDDFYTPFASGSTCADAMVIIPCSMGEVGRIASGLSLDLIQRVADVQLKERKSLVIVPRESPLNLIHLENLTRLSRAGAVIFPATPPLYTSPATVLEMAEQFAERLAAFIGLEGENVSYKWKVK